MALVLSAEAIMLASFEARDSSSEGLHESAKFAMDWVAEHMVSLKFACKGSLKAANAICTSARTTWVPRQGLIGICNLWGV